MYRWEALSATLGAADDMRGRAGVAGGGRLEIREANDQDLAGIMALYRELHPEDPDVAESRARAVLAQILGRPGLHVFVLERDERTAATCYLNIVPNLTRNASPYAIIENVVTTQRLRGMGLGQAVIRHALAFAWAAGCYKVMLQTGSRQEATHAFYRACGFSDTEKFAFLARPDTPRGSTV
jgi:GNAT superfamily N-acetyltransferase